MRRIAVQPEIRSFLSVLCLDLVISNIDTLRTQPRASLGKSDHIVIEGRVPAGDTGPTNTKKKPDVVLEAS